MYLRHLTLTDFRNYREADVPFEPGPTVLLGLNGQGKTNLVEAVGYLSSLGSHRVAQHAPLVRYGAAEAVVRGAVIRDGRESLIELQLIPGRANRARLNRSPVSRPREVLGSLRTVLFAPEDLALVKGDPEQRRRFLDDLLVQRQPRWAGVRVDYDRIVRQRNALLRAGGPALATLEVWNDQLSGIAAQLLYARLRLLRDLRPLLATAYDAVSGSGAQARATYRASVREEMAAAIAAGEVPEPEELRAELWARFQGLREAEIERKVTLAGPHRDDVLLFLGELPTKGYASHGESWSFALALRLAAFQLLRRDLRDDPVLLLDDVFAELDAGRRKRLAGLVADCEQVVITAAVPEDIPSMLRRESSTTLHIAAGALRPEGVDGAAATATDTRSGEEAS